MTIVLLTGAAGFIASKTADILLSQGGCVVGIDNLNNDYDVKLKNYCLNQLKRRTYFTFIRMIVRICKHF